MAAQAHNVWLLPSTTVLSKADWITVDAAVSNDLFYFNHVPLNLENLLITAPDGKSVEAQNMHKGKLRSVFDAHLTQTGTYRLAVSSDSLFASYKDTEGKNKRWRGTEASFKEMPADAVDVKVFQTQNRFETFVTLGKPTPLHFTGKGLELVPVTPLSDLVSGETASFIFHVDGKPIANMEVLLLAGATRYRDQKNEIKVTTDAKGQFSVRWPTAGMYWVDADSEDDKVTLKHATVRRMSYVATLEVLP
ncbi:ABC transporter permease [Polaromonas sp.]|nr:ABC transporter permease [Polaromonas sp.]